VQAITAPVAILLDAASFLASAVLVGRITTREPRPIAGPRRTGTARAVAGGMLFVWRNPLLRASAAAAGTYTFFSTAILALQVLYLSRNLEMSPAEIGILLGAAGPGGLIGAALAVRASTRWGLGPTMIGGLVVSATANLALPLASGPHRLVVAALAGAMFINGFGQPFYNINQSSLRQAIVPASMQGRVTATMTVLAGCAAPIGGIAGGLLGEDIGVRATLLAAALGTALACLWPLCSPLRSLATVPDSPTARNDADG
jgi:predicted MFS family arabinose efflux permease